MNPQQIPFIRFQIVDSIVPENDPPVPDFLIIVPRPVDPNSSPSPFSGIERTAPGRLKVHFDGGEIQPTSIRLRAPVIHRRFVRMYLFENGEWTDLGPKGEWIIPVGGSGEIEIRVASENFARLGRRRVAEWSGRFDLRASLLGANGQPCARTKVCCRVSPFLLTSSLDPVERVYLVDGPLTQSFVQVMEGIVHQCGARFERMSFHDAVPSDIWAQDCVEIGATSTLGDPLKQYPAILSGIRGKHNGIRTEPLDNNIRHQFAMQNAIVVDTAEPRAMTRWIDWYGNLEVTPAHVHSDGRAFPFGRVLIGKQNDLEFNRDTLDFLEKQGYQWPPIIVDVGWLTIGHVDEVINFIPSKSTFGFKVMMPSVRLARQILFQCIQGGHGTQIVFGLSEHTISIENLYLNRALSEENKSIEARLATIREQFKIELGISDEDFCDCPALFHDGLAVFPNMVNSLVCNYHVIIPDPDGPEIDGVDHFAEPVRVKVQEGGSTPHFVNVWEPFHVRSGEIHCATNALRRLRKADWWNYFIE